MTITLHPSMIPWRPTTPHLGPSLALPRLTGHESTGIAVFPELCLLPVLRHYSGREVGVVWNSNSTTTKQRDPHCWR